MIYDIHDLAERKNLTIKVYENRISVQYNSSHLTNDFLYFSQTDSGFKFSFDFFELCIYLKREGCILSPYTESFCFFVEKGYEPFDSTIIREVYKLPNLCELIIQGNDFKYDIVDLGQATIKDEKSTINKAICNSFDKCAKNIILFSGGFDSTLLAKIAKDNGYDVELVNGAYSDNLSANDSIEKNFSNKIADYLRLPYRVIKIEPKEFTRKDLYSIIESQPNTAHYSFIYYAINREISHENVNIISGQQADSILNYGSTSMIKLSGFHVQGLGELCRRYLYMKGNLLHGLIFAIFNGLPFRLKQASLLVGYRKLPIIKKISLYNSFADIYNLFLSKLNQPDVIINNNILFYSTSFLQGSDASGILRIMKTQKHPLPFSDLDLVKYYAQKNNSLSDVFYPKRIIHEILKEDKELYKILKSKPNIQNISYEIRFYQLAKTLNIETEYKEMASQYSIEGEMSFNKFHLVYCLNKIFKSNEYKKENIQY